MSRTLRYNKIPSGEIAYQLTYAEDGTLLAVKGLTRGQEVAQHYGDGSAVYFMSDCPKHACPVRKEDCHPDDLAFCRSRGHYQENETP
jgi:hypothetical protein